MWRREHQMPDKIHQHLRCFREWRYLICHEAGASSTTSAPLGMHGQLSTWDVWRLSRKYRWVKEIWSVERATS
eukprot:gene9637-biopygen1904